MIIKYISLVNIFLNIINLMNNFSINNFSIDNIYKLLNSYLIKKKIIKKIEEERNVEEENSNKIEHICYNCLKNIEGTMYCYNDNYYCSEECRNKYLDKVEYIKNGYRK